MTKDSFSKEVDSSDTTPFLSTSTRTSRSSKRYKSSSFLLRHRLFTLCLVTLISTVILTIYFRIPSTLWIYLTTVLILLPISVLHEVISLISAQQLSIWWTRNRTICVSLELFGIVLLCLPQLSHLATSGYPSHSSLMESAWWSRPRGRTDDLRSQASQKQTFFISANLFQSQDILPTFTANLIELSEILGRSNVFISIYESNSVDSTKSLLKTFDQELDERGIRHKIVSDDIGEHMDAGVSEGAGRIKMLAYARNKAQSAFYEASEGTPSPASQSAIKFDKVLWLNDIVFETKDVLELLSTNRGDFDQACAMDFVQLGFYDTWVARSSANDRLKPMWPYFSSPSDVERLRRNLPIEVNSCWNGMTAFDARWFYANITSSRPSTSTINTITAASPTFTRQPKTTVGAEIQSNSESAMDKRSHERSRMILKKRKVELQSNLSAPIPNPLPLRFRTSQRCYSSECQLISYDLHRALRPLGRRPMILINPKVRVAYDHRNYYLYSKVMTHDIVAPWRWFWQDLVSSRLFGWMTDWGRKGDRCKDYLTLWSPPPPSISLVPDSAVEKV